MTDQLVERVMPADVLERVAHRAALIAPRGRVQTAGALRQLLVRGQFARGACDRIAGEPGRKPVSGTRSGCRSSSSILSMPHTPQPVRPASARRLSFSATNACCTTCKCTSACGSASPPLRVTVAKENLDVVDVAAALDDAFRNRKADRERFEIARRAHHHRVRDAVEDERDRPFLTDVVRRDRRVAGAMAAHLALDEAGLIVCVEIVHFAWFLEPCPVGRTGITFAAPSV